MKKATKLVLVLSFIFLSSYSFSQRYAISGGFSFTDMKVSGVDTIQSNNIRFRSGFRLGTVAEYSLSDMFSFEPGLLLSMKGFNNKTELLGETQIEKFSILYLEAPVHLKVTTEYGNFKIFGLIGPYVGWGIKGKTKIDYKGQSEQINLNWGDDDKTTQFERLDYGFSVGAGMEIDKASFRITYSQGIMNIAANSNAEIINRGLSISFAYFFRNYYHKKYKY